MDPAEPVPADISVSNNDGAIDADDVLEMIEVEDGEAPEDDSDDDYVDDGADADEDGEDNEEEDMEMQVQDEGAVIDRGNNASKMVQAHSEPVFCLALSSDGQYLVSGGQDDLAILWDLNTWEPIQSLQGHKDSVIAVGISPDNKYIATGAMDGVIKVWSCPEAEEVIELDCGDDLTWLTWHPKANFVVAGNAAGAVMMWNVPGGNMSYFNGHTDAISCGAWLPTGRMIVSGSEDGSVILWSPKTQEIVSKMDARAHHMFHECPVSTLAVHPDSTMIATGAPDGAVKLVNLKANKVVLSFENHEDNVEAVAFSNSVPSLLATGSLDGKINLYTVDQQTLRHTCHHEAAIVKLRWHQTLPLLYSCSIDGTVSVWDGRTGQLLHQCVGHRNHVLDFVISPDGTQVITASEDTTIMLFSIASLPTS
eukprot:m.181610 g.181610  ORF g.181610 m.181610 type:complete len:423 (+) comp16872_c1_seq4:162-1430(+)